MEKYTYNWEIKDLLTQFLQAFDGAIVKRYNNDRVVENTIGARYIYAPKQRVLHDLVNKAQHFTLPVVAFWIKDIKRDVSRVFNKLEGQYNVDNTYSSDYSNIMQPVPVDIEVGVSMITRFQLDMEQLISNFVPYCDPYFVVSWTVADFPNIEIRTEIRWDNNLAIAYPVEQEPNKPTRVMCDTNFTIKGWLFKKEGEPAGRIYQVDTSYYAVSGTPTSQNIGSLSVGALVERFVTSSVPQIIYASRQMTPVTYAGSVEVDGSFLDTVTAVFLSGGFPVMFPGSTTVDIFSSTSLSATYPSLNGVVPVQGFANVTGTLMMINYQAPQVTGYFDIIVVSPAGYTSMISTINTYNAQQQLYVKGGAIPTYPENGIQVVNVDEYVWDTAYMTWDAATFQWEVA